MSKDTDPSGSFGVDYIRAELNGARYFVPQYAMHRPAAKRIMAGRYYEPQTHQFVKDFFARVPGSMVHAGTFFGDMLPNFSSLVPGRVYAFEPVLENYVLANLCVRENDLTNVFLFNAALGEMIDVLRVDTSSEGGTHAGGHSKVGEVGHLCPVVTIDGFDISDLALIQLDVEGFELKALKGALKTIARLTPAIAIEDNSGNCASFLTELGYAFAFEIPGLSIWTNPARPEVAAAVAECKRG